MSSKAPAKYEDIIHTGAKAAAAVGVGGAIPGAGPAIDIAGMTTVWTTMILAISERAGRPMTKDSATAFIRSFAKGAAAYIGGTIVFRQLLHLLPGIGTVSVMGINAAFNATYTYKFGCALVEYFEKPTFDEDDLYEFADDILRAITPSVGDIVGTVRALSTW